MKINVNGEPQDVDDELTAAQLVELLGLAGRRLAMEVNQEIVPRGSLAGRRLQAGDRVEIVHAIGGG